MTDFPKDRFGLRSFAGRRAAYGIAADDSTVWLRKDRFGATAKNRGGKLEVKNHQVSEVVAGYMSYGHVTNGPGIHAFSSMWAFGPYLDRGLFVMDTGFVPTQALRIDYYLKGFGSTITTENLNTTPDFNGNAAWPFEVTLHTTWDGQQFKKRYKFTAVRPYYGDTAHLNYVDSYPGSKIGNNETARGHTCGHDRQRQAVPRADAAR